jgi:hypothetical protein
MRSRANRSAFTVPAHRPREISIALFLPRDLPL